MTPAFDNSYSRLPQRFFTALAPTPVTEPKLVRLNEELAVELGFDPDWLRSGDGLEMLAGNHVPVEAEPLAQVYAGHQFGGWVPQLGDGRAILLGEIVDSHGRRRDIQLKGSGRTPYSRNGDGRAWLGPVLREYLVSEAMHALGIPTTRALAAVTTGERVQREKGFPGAIVTRVAASHIRVGTFQFFAARRDKEALQTLTDHAIERHFPKAKTALDLLNEVVAAQATLVAQWLGVGFIHGVMNTDNMTVSGETIDYGPCAFMDSFDPSKVFSSIDQFGRYAYNRQPDIAAWNLAQLATALLPLIDEVQDAAIEKATEAVNTFPNLFRAAWLETFRPKLGLSSSDEGDAELIHSFLERMAATGADFTNAFRALAEGRTQDVLPDATAFEQWAPQWQARLDRDPMTSEQSEEAMRGANPAIIPRNHLIEAAIQSALDKDFAPFHELADALQAPYSERSLDNPLTLPPKPEEVVHRTFCGT